MQPFENALSKLKFEKKNVILSHSQSKSILLQDCLIFPNHLDGLKIWEAGIVLSRFVIHNPELFKGKTVLDLGTGTGIASIALLKFTEAKQVFLTDYQPDILENALVSLKFNIEAHIHCFPPPNNPNFKLCPKCGEARAITKRFDWREQDKENFMADCIIGSDIIYTGGFLNELHEVMSKQLIIGGKAFIVIPSFRQAKNEFLKIIEKSKQFTFEVQELNDEKYLESPFTETTEGYRLYKGLKELRFSMYIFTKKERPEETGAI